MLSKFLSEAQCVAIKFFYNIEHLAPIPTRNLIIPPLKSEAASPFFNYYTTFLYGIGAG